MSLTLKKGDYGYVLAFTVQNSDGTAKDLTGYTVKLKVWPPGGALLFEGTCTITDAGNGKCTYNVASGNFASLGLFNGELELTKAGVIESTQTFTVKVEETV